MICTLPLTRQKKSKWHATLRPAGKQARSQVTWAEDAVDGNEDEEDSMQFNPKEQARDKDKVEEVKLQYSQSKQ